MREKLVSRCMLIVVLVLGSGLWGKAYAVIPTSERDALIALYNATNGDGWVLPDTSEFNMPWKENGEFRDQGTEWSWYGITLNDNQTEANGTAVERISLSNKNLVGTIPPQIENFPSLEYLNLDGNQLGSLPSELGNLPNLESLFIKYSQLTGSIPSSLGNLSNLLGLSLEGNNLEGSIPPQLGQLDKLENLSFAFNELTEGIPSELGGLLALKRLDLQVNHLTLGIPSSLGDLANLSELYLYQNELSGSIPPSLGNCTKLWQLVLDNNQLEGEIPSSLGNLDKLYRFSAGNNQLSGSIPAELGNMAILEWLQLANNQLSGTIPSNLSKLTLLKGLNLSRNQLTGTIPSWLNQLTSLTNLYLNDNQFTGSIPPELGSLTNLYELHLGRNQLTGSIPVTLTTIAGLYYLYLDNNNLSGPIPPALGNLTELRQLSLNGNYFSGNIPTGLTNLTNLTGGYLDLGYNALYTDNDALRIFLVSKDWNWEQSQTVAPEGVAAVALTATSVAVSYTPIEYDGDSGGYRILCSESQGGPYTLCGMTASKMVSEIEVTGLTPGTPYYFVVQTRTDPHTDSSAAFNNPNTVDSEYSEEVSAETPVWADLSVTKTDDPDPVTAGEMLIYTLTVENGGPSDAVNVTLTDSLPAQLEGVQYSIVGGKGWTSWPGSSSVALGTMAPAASGQVLIRGTVASSATGTISNTASVSSETTDPDMGNNDATEQTTVEARANLLVTKSDSVDPVIAGQALTYTITVQNQGPSNAVNVRLTDTVPSALQNPEYSTDGGQGWTAWPGTLLMGTLGPAGSRQVLIRGTVDASTTGTISNTPSVSSDTTDPDTNDNSVSEDTLVEAEADISVTKTDDGFDPTLAGNLIQYTITVINGGPSDAVDVILTDIVPSELKSPAYSIDGGNGWNPWPGSWSLGTLDPGSSKEVLIRDQVDPAATGSIINTASVNAATFDPNTDNNVASEQTTLQAKADLSITKEDSTDPVFAGQALTYTITVANAGPSDAVNVIVTDNVPSQVSNAQYSADGGTTWNDWEGSFNIERVEEGGPQTLLIRGTVASSSTGILSNTASVSSDTEDYISENNSDTEETFAVIMGDMNGDGKVDLRDVIFVLRVMGGMKPDYAQGHVLVDLDGDGKIGRGELFYVLQKISQVRE